jgi:hypothetical protein
MNPFTPLLLRFQKGVGNLLVRSKDSQLLGIALAIAALLSLAPAICNIFLATNKCYRSLTAFRLILASLHVDILS